MLYQLLSILAFFSMIVAAFVLGRPIVRGLGVGQEDRLSALVWSMALGLIAAGMFLLGLGMIGLLYVPVIALLTVAACAWALVDVVRRCARLGWPEALTVEQLSAGELAEWPPAPVAPPAVWLLWGILAAAAVACLGSLVGALAPPTAGDALCYHLELPKTFLLEHRIAALPYHDNATFPLLTEMWYLWGLALGGGVCAQLVHWGLGLLLAGATVVLATPILGRPWARVAGAVVVLTPGVNNQMTAPLNDVALAVFSALTLAAWWKAINGGENRRWFVVAGLAAGGALGTKYVALLLMAAIGATWLWAVLLKPRRRRLLIEGAAVAAVVAVSVGGPWYVRAAWYRGNPVFPFFSEVLADADAPAPGRGTLPASKSPLGRGPMAMAVAPWQITMHPERFGGRGHQLGVILLAALPGLLFCRRLRGLGTLLAVSSVYGVLWFLLRQNVRFLFPVVPPLCVATVWVWIELRRLRPTARWTAAAVFAAVVLAMVVVPLRRSRNQWAVAVGAEDRGDYLVRTEPIWPAAAVANELFSGDAHLLSQDYRGFHFNCRVTRENVYRRYTHYDREISDPAELARRLREAGFTHLLLAENLAAEGAAFDPTLGRLVDAQLATATAEELLTLTDYRYHDCDGGERHYRLVVLREQPRAE